MTQFPITIYYRIKTPQMTFEEFFEQYMRKIPSKTKYDGIIDELHDQQRYSNDQYSIIENYYQFVKRYESAAPQKYFMYTETTKVVEAVDIKTKDELNSFLNHARVNRYEVLMPNSQENGIDSDSRWLGSNHINAEVTNLKPSDVIDIMKREYINPVKEKTIIPSPVSMDVISVDNKTNLQNVMSGNIKDIIKGLK